MKHVNSRKRASLRTARACTCRREQAETRAHIVGGAEKWDGETRSQVNRGWSNTMNGKWWNEETRKGGNACNAQELELQSASPCSDSGFLPPSLPESLMASLASSKMITITVRNFSRYRELKASVDWLPIFFISMIAIVVLHILT